MKSCFMMESQTHIYIDKPQSETIKGLLIFLIVLLHNDLLLTGLYEGRIIEYIGWFHVEGFFILPFFYNQKNELSFRKVLNIIIRCWVPYFWLFVTCWLIYSVYTHTLHFDEKLVCSFFCGTQTLLRSAFGFSYMWFLPAFCTFSIVLLFVKKYPVSKVLFIALFILWLLMDSLQPIMFDDTVPIGLGLILTYLGAGSLVFALNKYSRWSKYVGTIVFVVLTIVYCFCGKTNFLFKVVPPFAFFAILVLTSVVKSDVLRLMGKHSLVIYLLSPLVGNLFFELCPKTMVWGLFTFALSILLPLCFSTMLQKVEVLRLILLPHDVDDLKVLGGILFKKTSR